MDDDFNKLDDEILDIDELSQKDFKINPEYYIHSAILKAQASLVCPDMRQGFIQYRQMIEHIERLSRASGNTPLNYDEKIKTFKDSQEKNLDETSRSVQLADYKLQLILERVFQKKTNTMPMRNFGTFKPKEII